MNILNAKLYNRELKEDNWKYLWRIDMNGRIILHWVLRVESDLLEEIYRV